ncbi:MAG TPA: ABC transporter permease [Acidimicrobiales bacterium]|nr:ABC transporter permease [Acidimicrobiales bacterium]
MSATVRRAAATVAPVLAAVVVGTVMRFIAKGDVLAPPIFTQALVGGAIDALFAIGLVLVYRAGRIVNFAQGSLGVAGAVLFVMLTTVWEWPFLFAFPLALALACVTGVVVEVLVVRRLSKAPRLALTVVTIGVSQVLVAVASFIPLFFLDPDEPLTPSPIRTPLSGLEWKWSPLVFSGDHVMAVVVAMGVMIGLAAFFRFSSLGIAVRGSAENSDRAELLGVSVNNLSTLVWVMAAGLSGLTAMLSMLTSPAGFLGAGIGTTSASLLLRGLTAAVIGRMDNLPRTVAASLAIAVFDRAMFWTFDNTSLTNVALLVAIMGVLFLQRAKLARTDEAAASSWAASEEIRPTPHELRHLPQVQAGVRRTRLALLVVAAAFPWVMSPAQTSLGSLYVIYGIVVISLVVLTGWGGQVSLGQFGFVAVGAVIGSALMMKTGLPFLVALVVASFVGSAVAVVIGLPAMRIKGLFLAVTTLAFAVVVATVFVSNRFFGWLIPTEVKRPKILFLDAGDERVFFYLSLAGLGFAYWVAKGLRNSRAGRVLIAMRENERTAQSYGINRVRTRLATFAISGFLASFAGVLLSLQQGAVRPVAFGAEQSVQIFLIAVIGGLGSVGGALVGVAYVALVSLALPFAAGQLLAIGVGVGRSPSRRGAACRRTSRPVGWARSSPAPRTRRRRTRSSPPRRCSLAGQAYPHGSASASTASTTKKACERCGRRTRRSGSRSTSRATAGCR